MFKSEERQIVDKIKEYIKDEDPFAGVYIMLRDGRILRVDDYLDTISDGEINPQDAYVYIRIIFALSNTEFYYAFLSPLSLYNKVFEAYLSKLGFYYGDDVVPATGLKYIVGVTEYNKRYLSIELVNLDVTVNNTNLPKIVVEVLGKKLVSGEKELTVGEYFKILDMYKSQQLFAGHNFEEAWNIIFNYYDKGDKSLVKEAARIVMDYDRIFQPYRVCYETRTWKEVNCF